MDNKLEVTTQERQISSMNTCNTNNLFQSSDKSKLVGCSIHKSIRIHPSILKIIHTDEFQRLHDIKQLGLCYLVFPSGKHSRFEHALGVYYLACQLINNIRKKYPEREYWIEELGIKTMLTDEIALDILIAALCHDIGHAMFSHCFDDLILKNSKYHNHPNAEHEIRSCLIIEIICKRELDLDNKHINFTNSLVEPTKPYHKGVIYQIVSNTLNGMDVDKYDYLSRDPYNLGLSKSFDSRRLLEEFIIDGNDNIAYSKHCAQDVLEMFQTRYALHAIVYSHKTTKIIELMYVDMFKKLEPIFHLCESISDMKKFCRLNDMTLFNKLDEVLNPSPYMTLNLTDEQLQAIKEADQIRKDINARHLYKAIFYQNDVSKKECSDFITSMKKQYPELKQEDLIISKVNVGYVGSNKPDPFLSIYFYDKITDTKTFTMNKTRISAILSNKYNEDRYLLVCKKSILAEPIKDHWKLHYEQLLKERKDNSIEEKIKEVLIENNPAALREFVNSLIKDHIDENNNQLVETITKSSLQVINAICKLTEEMKQEITK